MHVLERQLKTSGVNTESWGKDGAKSIKELHDEVHEERAVTFDTAEDGRFFRVVHVINVPGFGE